MKKLPELCLFLIFLLTVFTSTGTAQPPTRSEGWVMDKNSVISIQGSSNINRFGLVLKNYAPPDTLLFHQKSKGAPAFLGNNGSFSLPVQKFDNENSVITGIFKKAVKADQYPYIFLKFNQLASLPLAGQSTQPIRTSIEITVAGVRKSFDVDLDGSRNGETIRLLGSQKMKFSDFNLTPPERAFGLVRVNNELEVTMELTLKALPATY